MKLTTLKHDQLAEDLARHLAAYSTPMAVWTDMQLGPSGSARPDVFTIEKTYTALRARVFEVKVSRSDFLADVTAGKYLSYFKFAGSVTFATPSGLLNKDEIPDRCGLITRSDDGNWRYQRKPTLQATPDLPRHTWLKLVIDGCAREREKLRLEKCGLGSFGEWRAEQLMRDRAGDELALALSNRNRALAKFTDEGDYYTKQAEKRVAEARDAARVERQELDTLIANAASALGLPEGSSVWQVRQELDQRLGDIATRRVRDAVQSMEHALTSLTRERDDLVRLLPKEAANESTHG